MSRPQPITSEAFSSFSGIRHGFFTRQGGVSEGVYASLNCGFLTQDRTEAVIENRKRVVWALGFNPEQALLLTVHQVHGTEVATVDTPWEQKDAPQADAIVTDKPDVILGILTADCAPVLFFDPVARVIGAAHAGWRGALAGITDHTLTAMERLGADKTRITAVIGPCIGPASYEVNTDFRQSFLVQSAGHDVFFTRAQRYGHFYFDLPAYILNRLTQSGVKKAVWTGHDTLADEARFFSYRRATLSGGEACGRLVSTITMTRIA